jgi:hypothetical protein
MVHDVRHRWRYTGIAGTDEVVAVTIVMALLARLGVRLL